MELGRIFCHISRDQDLKDLNIDILNLERQDFFKHTFLVDG